MIEAIITILLIAILGGFLGLVFYLKKQISNVVEKDNSQDQELIFKVLKEDLKNIREEIKETREKNIESFRAHTESQRQETARIASDFSNQIVKVSQELTKFSEIGKRVDDQTSQLKDILSSPKQRGNLGEYNLKLVLESVFSSKQFKMQYEFKSGQTVDAVLFVGEKILPIDSKFSLENYNKILIEKDPIKKEQLEKFFKQDLKNRIDETAKYIKPQERTFDFALMFIPAEAIYSDLMNSEVGAIKINMRDLLDYAQWNKNVFIVSPNTFYVSLKLIFQGLRAFEIDAAAKDIIQKVQDFQKHIVAYEQEYMTKLGKNIDTVVSTYNNAYKELGKIDKDVVKITGGERQIEPLQIDKPSVLE